MAHDLFRMFRDIEIVTIEDGAFTTTVAFRALNYAESAEIMEAMTQARIEAQKLVDTPERKQMFLTEIRAWSVETVIARIIEFERPTAVSVVDLAPQLGDQPKDEEAQQKAEQDAVARWETDRRAQLKETTEIDLQKMLVDRLVQGEIGLRTNARYTQESLIRMVVDPQTREPILSFDLAAENFIGNLMPGTRAKLVDHWQAFVLGRGTKQLRTAARAGSFFVSGESPKPQDGTPGETGEKSSTSQLTLSSSTPSG